MQSRTSGRPGPPAVTLRSLCRVFREGEHSRPVLRSLDLDIAQGELLALVGRSGSGKSTLLNLISGIDLPSSGQITIGGVQLTTLPERERTLFRRRHIGFVYQFFNLIPTLTVTENVALPLELNGESRAAAHAAARLLLDRLGIADRRDAFPDRLSGGEQQRVAIARAVIHNPQLVLADEPTGNLDAETGNRVMALLGELTRPFGTTLLVATHSLDIIAQADRVLALENGQLVAAGREILG